MMMMMMMMMIQSFIGMVNHYRAHYPNLANDCVPLFNLLRKNVPFIWSLECKASFHLKDK
jgi:hypothetical protein